ncbi:hypothetical protein ABPG77_001694 [Micractinium sp. CCAP 211/92]
MRRCALAGLLAMLAALQLSGALAEAAVRSNRRLLDSGVSSAVFGGTAAIRGRYPWFVSLRLEPAVGDPRHFCGGFVVNYGNKTNPGALSGKIIITAAHCLVDDPKTPMNAFKNPLVFVNPWSYDIYDNTFVGQFPPPGVTTALNDTDTYSDATVFRTTYGSWMHPSYGYLSKGAPTYDPVDKNNANYYNTVENDIAILLLDSQIGAPFQTPTLRIPTAALLSKPPKPASGAVGAVPAGTSLRLVGMGNLKEQGSKVKKPDSLMEANLPLQSLDRCETNDPVNAKTVSRPLGGPWPAFPYTNNSRICSGLPYGSYAACGGDSGSAFFIPGDNAGDKVMGDDDAVGIESYSAAAACNRSPQILTDLATSWPWIIDTIKGLEATYFEYTMDIYLIDRKTKATFNGDLPQAVTENLQLKLGSVIAKKPNLAKTAVQVDFYSYKPDKSGRIRFKWTSKKKWDAVSAYFNSGVYNATCVNNGVFDYAPAVGKACKGGPFGNATTTSGFSLTPVSMLVDTARQLEYEIRMGFYETYLSSTDLQVKSILVSNGYASRPCDDKTSGIGGCYKFVSWDVPAN